ncbi:MAG: DinB family protein [Vicinamibacterales bacterium]
MSIADALLPEFDREMAVTRRVLERVPDGQFDWKPHAKSMSLGRLAEHLAELPQWVGATVGHSELDLATARRPEGYTSPATREAVLAMHDRTAAEARTSLSGRTDAELLAPWTLKSGGKEVFTMPKAAVLRSFVMNHLVHHRGQMTVYLRMLDQPVPSVYGPSADEQTM